MARLILAANETYGSLGPFSPTDVIGTAVGSEKVFVDFNGKANFDPSFNRGGDEIVIAGESNEFSGVRSGSNLLITNEFGAAISIPVGLVGAKVTFENGTFNLRVVDGSIQLGDQVIVGTAAKLDDVGAPISQPAAALSFGAELESGNEGASFGPSAGPSVSSGVGTAESGLLFLDPGSVYGSATSLASSNIVTVG